MSGKAEAKKTGQEVVDQTPTDAQVPDYIRQGQTQGRGSENVTAEDLVIPRLEIVQGLSPARDKQHSLYIEGAEEGLLFNSVTRELYGNKILIVPVLFKKEYLCWVDRKAGGGFRGAFQTVEEAQVRVNQLEEKDKVQIVDTAQHLCLLIEGDNVEEIMLSMSRSKMKVSRNFNALLRRLMSNGTDRWAWQFQISTIVEANPLGKYYNFHIRQAGFPAKPVYDHAEKLYESIKSGRVTVQADRSEETGEDASSSHAGDEPKEF